MEFNSPSARQHDVGKRTASLANGGLGGGGGGAWRGKRNGAKRGRVEELGWGVGVGVGGGRERGDVEDVLAQSSSGWRGMK